MKLLSIFLSSLLLAVGITAAASTKAHGELHDRMESIEETLGKLRRTLRDENQRAESLKHIASLQEDTLACKLLVPESIEAAPKAAQSKMKSEYRRMMVDLLRFQLDLEAALLDGDADAVKSSFKKIRNMEDTGHERFNGEEG